MPFESGSFAVSFFRLPNKLSENYLEIFNANAACKLDDVKDEQSVGWVSGRHILEREINEQTAICGGHLYLYFRIAERKIPSILLNAICRKRELEYMEENGTDLIPKKIKKAIKAGVIEDTIMKMPPSLTGVPMVIDKASNHLYLGASSPAQIDNFLAFFHKTLGIEPIQITLQDILARHLQIDMGIFPPVSFSGMQAEEEFIPSRDFFTWLWYFYETEGGAIEVDNIGEVELMIEGPLTFAFAAESKGAGETVVKKGTPLRSAEAKAALAVGKKLKKAKITITHENFIWTGTFDADQFKFSGFNLPEGEEMDLHSRFAERINYLNMFLQIFEAYCVAFAKHITTDKSENTEKEIIRWAKERDSL